jgi:iron(II)-dependent oxidoreductase
MSASPHKSPDKMVAVTPRPPYHIAALVCLAVATALGFGGWVFFTRRPAASPDKTQSTASSVARQTPTVEAGADPTPAATMPAEQGQSFPAGLVFVPGGEVILGGDGTTEPVQKAYVEPFSISETEVTNAQYAVYVSETHSGAAAGWKGGEFRSGTAQEPVTGVTWSDASNYCGWLGQKLGAPARLPTELEWTRAARGDQNQKYPWGSEWKNGVAASRESRVRAVKSYPTGVSPFGAFDMAGNVWEWVADDGQKEIHDKETGQTEMIKGKVVKGGAALEKPDMISAVARGVWPADEQNEWLGFRCVVPSTAAK